MSNTSIPHPEMPEAGDVNLSPESLARISALLGEIAMILAAGDTTGNATVESLRRLGCHLCGQLGRDACASTATPASDCPLTANSQGGSWSSEESPSPSSSFTHVA